MTLPRSGKGSSRVRRSKRRAIEQHARYVALRQALCDIAAYPLPSFEIADRGVMVPFLNANALRDMAKDAIDEDDAQ